MRADVDNALEGIRAIIQADGGDIRLVDVGDDGAVALELILDTAECRDCVMPREYLEPMTLDILSGRVPAVSSVSIVDPRETEA